MKSVLFGNKNNLPKEVENNLKHGYVGNSFFRKFLDPQKIDIDALQKVCDQPKNIDSSIINYAAKP